MAVAVLDRNVETLEKTEEKIQLKSTTNAQMTADERHNAKIGEIYQRLITPNAKVSEVLDRSEQTAEPVQRDIFAQRAVLVENARADADIFRADSPVNRREVEVAPHTVIVASADEEEENEDLRPTQTTIQYKTTGAKNVEEEGKISNASEGKRALFSKKEKIVIAVVASIVVAMFVLIVVNSAILSNMNNELSTLQSSLAVVKASFAGVSGDVETAKTFAWNNFEDFAFRLGMVR